MEISFSHRTSVPRRCLGTLPSLCPCSVIQDLLGQVHGTVDLFTQRFSLLFTRAGSHGRGNGGVLEGRTFKLNAFTWKGHTCFLLTLTARSSQLDSPDSLGSAVLSWAQKRRNLVMFGGNHKYLKHFHFLFPFWKIFDFYYSPLSCLYVKLAITLRDRWGFLITCTDWESLRWDAPPCVGMCHFFTIQSGV